MPEPRRFNYTITDPSERVLGRLLGRRAALDPDRPCLLFKGDRLISYAELDRRADQVGAGLHELGVRQGDKVAVFLPNSPEFVYLIFGLARLGAVLVTVNVHYKGSLLRHLLNNSGAQLIIAHASLVDRVAEVAGGLETQPKLLVLGGNAGHPAAPDRIEVIPEAALFELPPRSFDVQVRAWDLQQILYTSGTTGPSKGVMITHNQAYAFADYVAQAMRMTADDRYYSCLPLFHINSQLTLLGTILNGASTVLYERFSASSFWSEVSSSGATAFSMFGAMAYILYKQEAAGAEAESKVRVCWAFPAPYDILEDFERRFRLRVLTAYASTEANFVAIADLSDSLPRGAAGRVHPRFEVGIVDEDDQPLPPGKVGEIVTRSRDPYTMMLGYYRMPEASANAFRNLWYHSGDAGYVDDQGYLYFVDRIKDVIRRRGENISSYEVEEVVNGHPDVLESAAVPVKSEMSEDEIKIVVVPRPGVAIDPSDLARWCADRMAYFMVPRFIEIREELPKTPTGKVEKHKLRERSPDLWDRERSLGPAGRR